MASKDFSTTVLTDLLARARSGEAGARNELLQCVQDRLEHLARKMLGNYPGVARWEDTLDVLQNGMLRLLRALDAVTPASTREFFGLAAEQIRRELIDLARRYRGPHGLGRRHRSGANMEAGDGPVADAQAPSDDPADLEQWTEFHEAVQSLPVEEREVFMLCYYQGWTQARIAELLQVDERTIRRRWRSAGRRLHELLGGRLPDPEES